MISIRYPTLLESWQSEDVLFEEISRFINIRFPTLLESKETARLSVRNAML